MGINYNTIPGQRIRQGNGPVPRISWKQYSSLENFEIFSGNFRPFPDGKNWRESEVTGKNPKISGREYCFHLTMISHFFLQDTVIFIATSHRFLQYPCPEPSSWDYLDFLQILFFSRQQFRESFILFNQTKKRKNCSRT